MWYPPKTKKQKEKRTRPDKIGDFQPPLSGTPPTFEHFTVLVTISGQKSFKALDLR